MVASQAARRTAKGHPTRTASKSMALIELRDIRKNYQLGEIEVPVLRGINLTIERGEFVALMGASGSGKTTLMNLIGCLDRPTEGEYTLDGIRVSRLSPAQLAVVRSRQIGFVFQGFNLLSRTTAVGNVFMPTAYSAERVRGRELRARGIDLLETVGLGHRLDHRPAQMSGGEQQRVAIARALINQPTVLLADEPTGNLDSRTGREILRLFRELNTNRNITLLLVTHDAEVARHADRIIHIADGQILSDTAVEGAKPKPSSKRTAEPPPRKSRKLKRRGWSFRVLLSAISMALEALRRNLLRSMLTMLGVIIGVAAVIAMIEISQGATKAIQVTVTNMGANTLVVMPSPTTRGGVSSGSGTAETLTPDDARAIRDECPAVVCTAPIVYADAQVVYGNRNWVPRYVLGSTTEFLQARNWTEIELGRAFDDRELRSGSRVCLIGHTVMRELFGDEYPIGAEIRVQNVPFTVIGVLSEKGANLLGVDQDDILLAPWTTMKYRVSGQGVAQRARSDEQEDYFPGRSPLDRLPTTRGVRSESIHQVLVQVASHEQIPAAVEQIGAVLRDRHRLPPGEEDFRIWDNSEVSDALTRTVGLLSALVLAIAAVSLIVGGVGIMNIMLVSVSERTREIGLRMAVGANAGDILRQFLVESVVLCLAGGIVGIAVGRGASLAIGQMMGWPTEPSPMAALVSVAVAVTVGITFGYYPAWKASRLIPIEALRYE